MIKITFMNSDDTHRHFASANFVQIAGKKYLATAAHCVFDPLKQEISKDIRMKLRVNGKTEIGIVTGVSIDNRWKEQGLLRFDNAICSFKFESNFEPFAVETAFNYLPEKSDSVSIEGVSAGRFFNKSVEAIGHPDLSLLKSNQIVGISAKMKQGVSGGPLFSKINGEKKQVGVITASLQEAPGYIWCTVWNREAFNLVTSL